MQSREPDIQWLASLTESQYREYSMQILHTILATSKITEGRLNKLERFMWMVGGALLVIGAIVVPLFLAGVTN